MRKAGFTLSEVLIALGILGVVAAATMITLKNVIPEDYTYTTKKASVTLSEGVKTMLSDDRKYAKKEFEGGERFCKDYTGLFRTGAKVDCNQHVAINALEDAAKDGIPADSVLYDQANLRTTNNEVWWGLTQNFSGDAPIKVITDVNGPNKGRNLLGEDIIALDLYKNGKIGLHEVENTGRTPDKDKALGTCTPIGNLISRENLSDTSSNEGHNVSHRLCYKEKIRCEKDGKITETTRPEVCIECPDVEGRKVLIQNNDVITRNIYANMAITNRAGTEYGRVCPSNIGNIKNNLKYENGDPIEGIVFNESQNSLETAKIEAKEQHVTGYYGASHIEKINTCKIRQQAALINKYVYEKGVQISEEISGMNSGEILLWSEKKASNIINRTLQLDNSSGNDCGSVNTNIYQKANRGAAVRMKDAESLKMLLGTASKEDNAYMNLGCGYMHQCAQIERDCGGTEYYRYKEFDVPYIFGTREDGVSVCSDCVPTSRNILKVTMTDVNNTDYACRVGNQYGDCPGGEEAWTDTKYKKQCKQYRRSCTPLTVGSSIVDFSSNFPGGNKGGDANMNLGENYKYDGGKTGCIDCDLSNTYFLKTDKNQTTATSENSIEKNGNTFKYMTACTQVSRTCEDPSLNQGFKDDKSKNLLGCSACYSENKIKNRMTDAVCEMKRICTQADNNGTGRSDNAYKRYTDYNTDNVEYSCGCEQLSTTASGVPHSFKYCQNIIGSYCSQTGKSNSTVTSKEFLVTIPTSHQNKEVYGLRRLKDNSNNLRNAEQILEYEDYNPTSGNLTLQEEKLDPYFIVEGCDAGEGFVCSVDYDKSSQQFKVIVQLQLKCTKTCSGDDWKEYGDCKTCLKEQTYSCVKDGETTTCTKCQQWGNNDHCMRYEAVNDTISKVVLYYTYADPRCSREITPYKAELCSTTSCMLHQSNSGDSSDFVSCGTCTIVTTESTCTKPATEQLSCSNPKCNSSVYDVGDSKKCDETKKYTLDNALVIGDGVIGGTSCKKWLEGVKSQEVLMLTRNTSDGWKTPCKTKTYNITDFGYDSADKFKPGSCAVGNVCGQDYGGSSDDGGWATCGKYSMSCTVSADQKNVSVELCSKYIIAVPASKKKDNSVCKTTVVDWDDWGIKEITFTVIKAPKD